MKIILKATKLQKDTENNETKKIIKLRKCINVKHNNINCKRYNFSTNSALSPKLHNSEGRKFGELAHRPNNFSTTV